MISLPFAVLTFVANSGVFAADPAYYDGCGDTKGKF
jgi:hypothetical protein